MFMISLVLLFVIAGVMKIPNYRSNVIGLTAKPIFNMLPVLLSELAIFAVILIEILAPLLMVYGLYNSDFSSIGYYSTVVLLLFTIAATALYHNPIDKSQRMAFLKNLSIIGGLGLATTLYV